MCVHMRVRVCVSVCACMCRICVCVSTYYCLVSRFVKAWFFIYFSILQDFHHFVRKLQKVCTYVCGVYRGGEGCGGM